MTISAKHGARAAHDVPPVEDFIVRAPATIDDLLDDLRTGLNGHRTRVRWELVRHPAGTAALQLRSGLGPPDADAGARFTTGARSRTEGYLLVSAWRTTHGTEVHLRLINATAAAERCLHSFFAIARRRHAGTDVVRVRALAAWPERAHSRTTRTVS